MTRALLPKDQDTALLFLDESGSIAQDRFFAVGCLKLPQPSLLLRQVQLLRDRRKWYGEFHFTKLTSGAVPIFRELIDLVVASDATFSCFVADRQRADPIQRFGTSYAAYEKLATQLVIGAVRPSEITAVLADNYSTPSTVDFEGSVKRQVNRRLGRLAVIEVCRLNSASSDPLQIVDVLTGMVAFQYRARTGLGSSTSPKGQLSAYAASSFGVTVFDEACSTSRIRIRGYEHGRWSGGRPPQWSGLV